jgi:hypothetical protein
VKKVVHIDPQRLRALAGPAFARGEAYWRDGAVRSCKVADGHVEGVVVGSSFYQVRLAMQNGALASECTCPVVYEVCKHAVALALHYLDQTTETVVTWVPGTFSTKADVETFVAEHHVQHMLGVSAEAVLPRISLMGNDYWVRGLLPRLALRDIASLEGAARHARARDLDQELARATYE